MQQIWRDIADFYVFITPLGWVLGLLTAPSILLARRGRPTAALSWLFFLALAPILGALVWWAIGRMQLERQKERRSVANARVAARHGCVPYDTDTAFRQRIPLEALGQSVFPSADNRVRLLIDGEQAYPAMLQAIAEAKSSIRVQFYIWRPDATGTALRDALAARAADGLTVQVLVDSHGSPGFTDRFARPLRDAGARIHRVMPWRLLRRTPRVNFVNHRKILVIDDRVAFNGGMNVGDEYRHTWRDLMLRIEGKAVLALRQVFLADLAAARGDEDAPVLVDAPAVDPTAGHPAQLAVVASGPDQDQPWIHLAYFQAFTQAERRIWIATPYFIPSQALIVALQAAESRGVDVRVVVPQDNDIPLVGWACRSYHPQMLRAGIRVFEYRGAMLHAKAFVVDDDLCMVGSANVDTRSFHLSFEVGCFMISPPMVEELAAWYATLLDGSDEVMLPALEQQSRLRSVIEAVAHLASPLL
ncbi:MAG: cardiolipin synthase [bacterium]